MDGELIGRMYRLTETRLDLNALEPGSNQALAIQDAHEQGIEYHARADFGYGGFNQVSRAEQARIAYLAIQAAQ